MSALIVASSLLTIAATWIGKLLMDAITHSAANPLSPSASAVLPLLGLELAIAVTIAAAEQAVSVLRRGLSARLELHLRLDIMAAAARHRLSQTENGTYNDQLNRAKREASNRPLTYLHNGLQLLRALILLLGHAVLVAKFSWAAGALLLLATVPTFLAGNRYARELHGFDWSSTSRARRLHYLEHVATDPVHAKEIKHYRLFPLLVARFRDLKRSLQDEQQRLDLRRAADILTWSTLASVAFYACYARIAVGAAFGEMSIGDVVMYLVAFRTSQGALNSVLSSLSGIHAGSLYMRNLFDFLAAAPQSGPAAQSAPANGERGIRFENVSFKYPGTEVWALLNVSFFIPPGQSVALVGRNGSGKTTLIKLIAGLYTPASGRVLMDGKEVSDDISDAARSELSIMFQDFNRYQLTVRDNVGFGSLEALTLDPVLARALDASNSSEMVKRTSHGLETQLGRQFAGGVELSGGEWQKLALARALINEAAGVVVLDEPTAALDPRAEHATLETLKARKATQTIIVASHRLSIARKSDRILVLERGCLREDGSHEALLAHGASGTYSQLFEIQAQDYQ